MLILNQNTSVRQKRKEDLKVGHLANADSIPPSMQKYSVTWTTQNQRYDEAGLDLRPSRENSIKKS